MRSLVILTSDRVSPVRRALALGLDPIVVTPERYRHLYQGIATTVAVPALTSVDAVLAALRGLTATHALGGLLAATEKSVPAAGFARTVLGMHGLDARDAVVFTSKSAMKRRWAEAGVPTAAFRSCSNADDVRAATQELGYPVVVKPTFGAGGHGTRVIRSPADLDDPAGADQLAAMAAATGVTVEGFIGMTAEYHCDSVVRSGEVIFTAVSRYFQPLLEVNARATIGSYVLPATAAETPRIASFTEAAVRATGIRDGITHFECFETDQGLVAGEVACRPGGGGVKDSVRNATGVDIWDELVRAEAQLPTDVNRNGVTGVHGWMFLTAEPPLIEQVDRLPEVTRVRPDAQGSPTFVVDLSTGSVDQMRAVQRRIAGMV